MLTAKVLFWNGIYALKPYVPRIASLREMDKENPLKLASGWVFNFKQYGRNSSEVRHLVETLSAHLGCDQIIAIPPSSPDRQPNELQKLFGISIRRTDRVESRKYNHKRDLPDNYAESYALESIEPGKKLLLIDDICTSGITLNHFRQVLTDYGCTVYPAAVGLHHKLECETPFTVSVFQPDDCQAAIESKDYFAGITEVVSHLKDLGYKIAQSTVYKHKDEGKIRPQKDGSFSKAEIDRYAKTFLKNSLGQTGSEELDQLQREKIEAEARKAKAQAVHWELKTKVDSGQYIDKDLFNGELAARASIFKSDFENFFRSAAGEIIHKVNGDLQLVPDLIDFLLERLEMVIGRYAEPKVFKVKHDNCNE